MKSRRAAPLLPVGFFAPPLMRDVAAMMMVPILARVAERMLVAPGTGFIDEGDDASFGVFSDVEFPKMTRPGNGDDMQEFVEEEV